MGESQTNFKL